MQVKKKQGNTRTTSTRKNIRFDNELLTLIEAKSGDKSFSAWVQNACREKLENEKNA
jgi:hypothetical protein